MAVEYIAQAAKLKLKPRDKFVLIALANYANDDGEAWPKQATLAEWTCYERDTINKALQSLEEAGLITSQTRRYPDGRNASKVYRLTLNQAKTRVDETDSGKRSRVDETYTGRVDETYSVRVDETYSINRQLRPVNLEPRSSPPTPQTHPPAARTPKGGDDAVKELHGENALKTLTRKSPRVDKAFQELARLQGTSFKLKLTQAEHLLTQISSRGENAVAESLETILASAGDGGMLFGRAMKHLAANTRNHDQDTRKQHDPNENLTGADLLDLDIPLDGIWKGKHR